MKLATIYLFVATWILALDAQSQRIDFETLPDGTAATNGMVISNQFSALPFGVRFQFEDGTYPVISEVDGKRATASFLGPPSSSKPDRPAIGQDVGRFFLSNALGIKGRPSPLIVTYAQAVSAASGFILDIDHRDAWEIEARNGNEEVIDSRHLESHTAPTGDGVATPWSFVRSTADIQSLRISYSGGNADVGFAFDNFSPAAAVPVPLSARPKLELSAGWLNLKVEGTEGAVYLNEEADSVADPKWVRDGSIILPKPSVPGFALLEIPQFMAVGGASKFFRVTGWNGGP